MPCTPWRPFVSPQALPRRNRPRSHSLSRRALLLAYPTVAISAELPARVSRAKGSRHPAESIGVVVQGVDSATPLIRHNAVQPMNPASAMKLVTTYAALELPGPAYTWKTEALVDSAPINGQLNENLYLRSSGDPAPWHRRAAAPAAPGAASSASAAT